jgi:hypothetical protein
MKHLTCSISAHRRTLACVLAVLASSAAAAGTTTLGSETCTRTQLCYTPPNSAGWEINYISDATQYGELIISVNGVAYSSGAWAYPNLAAFTLYDPAGNSLSGSLSITIKVGSTCVQSGRTCVFPKTVTLNGGKLTRP